MYQAEQHPAVLSPEPDNQVVELGMKWNQAQNQSESINYLTSLTLDQTNKQMKDM